MLLTLVHKQQQVDTGEDGWEHSLNAECEVALPMQLGNLVLETLLRPLCLDPELALAEGVRLLLPAPPPAVAQIYLLGLAPPAGSYSQELRWPGSSRI